MDGSRASKKPGWLVGCLVLIISAASFLVLLLLVVWLTGREPVGSGLSLGRRVGLIELRGEIMDARGFLAELHDLQEDPRLAALVVRIDSPGGDVGATQEIYAALRRFQMETARPLVVSLGSVAASGGYYAACAGETIMAEPGTLTGSIGVILSSMDASELMKKIGLRVEVMKSGPKKDAGAYWRPLSADEQAMLQGVVLDVYDQFVEAVAESRKLSPERIRELADGSIFTGRQARGLGLVDTLGYQGDALRLAAEKAGVSPEAPPLSKRRFEPELFDLIRRLGGRARLLLDPRPRLLYR